MIEWLKKYLLGRELYALRLQFESELQYHKERNEDMWERRKQQLEGQYEVIGRENDRLRSMIIEKKMLEPNQPIILCKCRKEFPNPSDT